MTAEPRLVTVVATIRTTADEARIRAAFLNAIETPLEEYDTALVPCGWAPDPDTIADCTDPLDPDEADLHRVEVIDLNPGLD